MKINLLIPESDLEILERIISNRNGFAAHLNSRIFKLGKCEQLRIGPPIKKQITLNIYDEAVSRNLQILACNEGISIPRLIEKYEIIPLLTKDRFIL